MSVFAFLSLPDELQLAIIAHLDWPTLTSLRLACMELALLIPAASLVPYHAASKQQVQRDEHALLRLLNTTLMVRGSPSHKYCLKRDTTLHLALPSFPNNPTNMHTHRRHTELITYLSYLPCYTCLRWLYAREPGPLRKSLPRQAACRDSHAGSDGKASENCFSGAHRILPTLPAEPYPIETKRICIACGVRRGLYVRNIRVGGFQICAYCGVTELRLRRSEVMADWYPRTKESRLCVTCRAVPKVAQLSELQFRHEMFWGRYEKGMRQGKEARVSRGMKRRAELGIKDGTGGPSVGGAGKVGRWCPVMREIRLCSCYKRWNERNVATAQDPDQRQPFIAHLEWVGTIPIRRS